jgi:hypothetical protein
MESAKIFIILVIFLSLYINSRVISYLYSLDDINCECALTNERKYILFYTLFSVILTFIFMIVSLLNPNMFLGTDMYYMTVVNKLLSFINIIVTIYYLNKLRNCPCSESPTKNLMFYMVIGGIIGYIITIIFGNC